MCHKCTSQNEANNLYMCSPQTIFPSHFLVWSSFQLSCNTWSRANFICNFVISVICNFNWESLLKGKGRNSDTNSSHRKEAALEKEGKRLTAVICISLNVVHMFATVLKRFQCVFLIAYIPTHSNLVSLLWLKKKLVLVVLYFTQPQLVAYS